MIAVAAGGACGSLARWLLAGWVQRRLDSQSGWSALFPAGTLAVNLLGCLAIGFLATLYEERLTVEPALRTFVLVGMIGGFTTFSAFGFETLALLRAGSLAIAAANVTASVAGGLGGVWLGTVLARLAGGGAP